MTRAKRRARRRIRRRIFIAGAAVIILAGAGFAVARVLGDSPPEEAAAVAPTTTRTTAVSATSSTTASTTTTTTTIPSSTMRLHLVPTGTGGISPKSVASPASGYSNSFVYRIDVAKLAIDQVTEVGAVPKFVAVSPDGRYVLVANWCSYDLSVIDTATGAQVKRLPIGRYPRGIAIDPTSR